MRSSKPWSFVARLLALALASPAGLLGAEGPASATSSLPWPTAAPTRIYVLPVVVPAEMRAAMEDAEGGRLLPEGPLRKRLKDAVGVDQPLAYAVGARIAESLKAGGAPAVFWESQDLPPADGWHLSSQVVQFDPGSKLAETAIGFGVGNAELAVDAALADPATAGGQPFWFLDTSATGRSIPGTLPIAAAAGGLNPAVVVGRVFLSRSGLQESSQQKRLADDVAKAVLEALREHGQLPAAGPR